MIEFDKKRVGRHCALKISFRIAHNGYVLFEMVFAGIWNFFRYPEVNVDIIYEILININLKLLTLKLLIWLKNVIKIWGYFA
jgi:hypothetical protein